MGKFIKNIFSNRRGVSAKSIEQIWLNEYRKESYDYVANMIKNGKFLVEQQ